MRRLLLLIVLLLPVLAARPAGPAVIEREKWTVEDVVHQEWAADFQISPDGRYAVWVKSMPDRESNEHVGQLFRVDLKSHREVQLTRSNEECTDPRWAPDGQHLAFLSSRPAPTGKGEKDGTDDESRTQVWLLDPTGGEPWPLTDHSRNVQRYAWAGPDAIVFAAQEEAGRRETVLKEEKDSTHVPEDEANEPPVRLFRAELSTRKVTRLTNNTDRIEQLAISPDGRHAVALHARSMRYTYDNRIKPVAYLHDLATGKRRRVLADPKLNLSVFLWAPDGKGFYALHENSSKPQLAMAGVTQLYYHDLTSGNDLRLELDWPRGLAVQADNDEAAGIVPLEDGFLALLADGIRPRAARYTRQGNCLSRRWLEGVHTRNLFGLAATRDGKSVLYAHSTAQSPTRWFHARLAGVKLSEPVEIAACNPGLEKKRFARAEVVRWKGARGEQVEGLLFHPHSRPAGQKAPLVVQIHGGPASADHDNWDETWSSSANLVCQRGAFVLRPNYHGSAGYGQGWLDSIADGRYGELEVEDIERGVDELIARGLVDGGRLALSGWSNGAILTNMLIAQTTRYRAAVAGAGSIEYVSDWASCEFGEAFNRFYFGKSPLEDLALYNRKSPFHRLGRVTTPTLILFGAEDRVVHPQQGWAQYRAMQQLGRAPVRFVLFNDEKHSLKKLSHQKRKLEEEMAWLDRHLFGVKAPSEEFLRPDSPLAWRLKRAAARRVGILYGVLHQGLLIPEVVRHGPCRIGRFEVTRGQYARFDPRYGVEPGTENYPASGIRFAQAKEYCAWLSARTKQRYRLPTAAEAEELYEKPEQGDNTLDAWAGYAVNPEDAVRLREKMKALPGKAPLLREVGMGRGVGKEELVYDLGGNVAEWVEGKKGMEKLCGGSADTPADTRGKGPGVGEEYRGFRVVLD